MREESGREDDSSLDMRGGRIPLAVWGKPFCRIPIVQREGPTSCTPGSGIKPSRFQNARPKLQIGPDGFGPYLSLEQDEWFVGGVERTVVLAGLEHWNKRRPKRHRLSQER